MADISSWWREDRSDESSEEIHSSTPALRGTWEGVYGVCVCGGGGGGEEAEVWCVGIWEWKDSQWVYHIQSERGSSW